MNPRDAARQLAIGRVVLGVVMLLGERRTRWLLWGPEGERPIVKLVGRLVGGRDAFLGALLLHTVDHSPVNKNMLRGLAVIDAIDFTAAVAGRKSLPLFQRLAFFLVAGGSAVAHAALAQKMGSAEGLESVAAQSPPQPASSPETVMPDGADEAERMMGARTINVPTPGSSG